MRKVLLIMAVLISQVAIAQNIESPISWAYSVKKVSETEAIVTINAQLQEGWYIYSQFIKEGGPLKTILTFEPAKGYELLGETTEENAQAHYDSAFKMDIAYFKNFAIFKQKIKLTPNTPLTIKCKLDYSPCNDKICLMPEQTELNLLID